MPVPYGSIRLSDNRNHITLVNPTTGIPMDIPSEAFVAVANSSPDGSVATVLLASNYHPTNINGRDVYQLTSGLLDSGRLVRAADINNRAGVETGVADRIDYLLGERNVKTLGFKSAAVVTDRTLSRTAKDVVAVLGAEGPLHGPVFIVPSRAAQAVL